MTDGMNHFIFFLIQNLILLPTITAVYICLAANDLEIHLSKGKGGYHTKLFNMPHFCTCSKPGHTFFLALYLWFVMLRLYWEGVHFETGVRDLLFVGGVAHFEDDVIDCWGVFHFEAGEIYYFLGSGSFWGWWYWLLRGGSFWGWWYWLFAEEWFLSRLVICTVCWVVHFETGEMYCLLGEWLILRMLLLTVEHFILRLVRFTVSWGSGSFWGWWYWLLRGGSFWGWWYWLLRSGSFWGWWYWLFVGGVVHFAADDIDCWEVVHFEACDIDCWGMVHFEAGDM